MKNKAILVIGAVFAISGISQNSLATIAVGVAIILSWLLYFKNSESSINWAGYFRRLFRKSTPKVNGDGIFKTYVTGMSYEGREDYIKKYLGKPYNGKTTREIEEYLKRHERIYEYPITNISVQLVPEPNNEYDKNAISVRLNGKTIGYIPTEDTKEVKTRLNQSYVAEVSGGKFSWMGKELFTSDGSIRINLSFFPK